MAILVMMLMVPSGVKAKEFNYPFADLAAAYSDATDNFFGNYPLTLSSTSYPSITNGFYGVSTTYGNVTVDFSKFAFRSDCSGQNQGKGWYLCNSNRSVYVGCGLFVGNGTPEFAITNLKNGDIIEVSFRGAADKVVSLGFVSGNAEQNGSALANGAVLGTSTANNITTVTFTSTSKGDIIIKANGTSDGTVKYTTYLTNIKITRPDVASYNYDPAKEIYDLTKQNSGSVSMSDKPAGYSLDNGTAYYIVNSGYELNNRVAIKSASDLSWNSGLQYSGSSYSMVSISDLNSADRVRITLSGNVIFANEGSVANGEVFLDASNDGEQDEAEDVTVQGGNNVASETWYTLLEDGHLDLVLLNGAKITKIEIVSDHQAVMLDRYNGSAATGYTAYFESTGQLMAKEHIVPGGLNVYVGNSEETQHAEVVMSDRGPVSFVYDQGHYKMARQQGDGMNVDTAIPVTGTFYKFIPEVDGYMSMNFKAVSIRYNNYWNGDGTSEGNEQIVSQQCPYYLMQLNGNTFGKYVHPNGNTENGRNLNNGAVGNFNNIRVEAGKTYYMYGWWNGTELGSQYVSCGVAHLIDVTFIPDNMITPLAKWVASGTTSDEDLADATGFTTNDLHIKKLSSNITSCEPYIEGGKLKIRNIVFAEGENPGGTILIKLGDPGNDNNPVFAYTIAYDAGWNSGEGYKWDFSTNPLRGLKWTDTSGQADDVNFGTGAGPGLLYDEMHETLNNEPHSDWTFEYRVKKGDGGLDPMYLNKYNMEGDNADMMWDTEGLIINTGSNQSAINNEYTDNGGVIDHTNTTNRPDPDRYVGILPGGEFRIPQLMKDDRVIIYMGSGDGSGAESVFMNIENARDAVYAEIDSEDEYHLGGSLWNANSVKTTQAHGDPYYRGCYHFFATGDPNDATKPADMIFKLMNKGTLVKLYSIEIYRGDRRMTNSITRKEDKVDSWVFATEGSTNRYNLHYRGKGENIANTEIIARSGNNGNFSMSTDGNDVTCTSGSGDFGMLRLRLKCMEYNHNYVADFADHNVTVACQKTLNYPYTWDFTDIKTFSGSNVTAENTNYPESDKDYEVKGWDLSIWDANGKLNLRNPDYPNDENELYGQNKGGGGNQLYANGKIIPETEGLMFYFDNNDNAYTGSIQIAADGLHLVNPAEEDGARGMDDQGNIIPRRRGWWNNKVIVPSVPAGAAVYIRAARDEVNVPDREISFTPYTSNADGQGNPGLIDVTETFFYKTYQFNGNMTQKVVIGEDDNSKCYQASDGSGDYILAILNTGETSNLTLTLNGWILKKMSVSRDFKKVNKLGWATESRARVIDPELTSTLTGYPFKTYIVTGADHSSKTVTLAEVDVEKKVMPFVSEDGDENAYIIRNTKMDNTIVNAQGKLEPGRVKILNDGFHLFVPDMHDYVANREDGQTNQKGLQGMTNTLLKSQLAPGTVSQEGDGPEGSIVYNYVLTTETASIGSDGENIPDSEQSLNYVGFFRVQKGGVTSSGNQGYLPVTVSSALPAKFSFVFVKDWELPTAIETPGTIEFVEGNSSYYNMNGQRLNGKPSKSGIYIVNGKKVVLK